MRHPPSPRLPAGWRGGPAPPGPTRQAGAGASPAELDHHRRFTRLTNAFSKKVANLEAAVALHFMHYNFCRIHQSLRVTPAMEAGVTKRLRSVEDIVNLLYSN